MRNDECNCEVQCDGKGFGEVVRLNYTDGVRIGFNNGDVAHLRPSDNADELRIYSVADTEHRAKTIDAFAIAEPDGIFRALERSVGAATEIARNTER